ncbi:MAG: hypothetical protein ACREHG_04195, partial [Candidatus Saccharimonadales bacterium]
GYGSSPRDGMVMKLDNPFPQRVRLLYLYNYACFDCGRSDRGLELHHIFGRDYACATNAFPICPVCHAKAGHSRKEHTLYYFINLRFLHAEHYVWLADDYAMLDTEKWLVDTQEWKDFFAPAQSG